MSPKKSESATVARLSQTGYSTDSDFFGLKFDPEGLGKTGFESGKYRQASGKTARFRGKLHLCHYFGSGISNIFARNAWQDSAASTPCILLRGRI